MSKLEIEIALLKEIIRAMCEPYKTGAPSPHEIVGRMLVDRAKAQQIQGNTPMNKQITIQPAMKQGEIAKILGVSTRRVTEQYAKLPGFPQPFRLPSEKGQGAYRWDRETFIAWYRQLTTA